MEPRKNTGDKRKGIAFMKKRISISDLIFNTTLIVLVISLIVVIVYAVIDFDIGSKNHNDYFTEVYHSNGYNIVYDNDTKVMYYIGTTNRNYTLSPLLDEKGKPKLYKEDK